MSDKEAEQEGMKEDTHELEDEEKDESEEGGREDDEEWKCWTSSIEDTSDWGLLLEGLTQGLPLPRQAVTNCIDLLWPWLIKIRGFA